MIGTEIIPFGPFEAEKIGFNVSNLKLEILDIGFFKKEKAISNQSFSVNFCDNHQVSVLIGKPTARGFQNTPYN